MRDDGAALIEAAIVTPVLLLLLVGGLMLGLATVEDLRLERAAADAALLPENEARQIVEAAGGTLTCWSDTGECFNDGLNIDRIQVVAQGREWVFLSGSVTPIAHVSRPTEGTQP